MSEDALGSVRPTRTRPSRVALVAIPLVLLSLALAGCCVGISTLLRHFDDRYFNAPTVLWSDSAEFAVAQLWDSRSVPLIAVWERDTGTVRTLHGYRLTAIGGERAWVVADDGPWAGGTYYEFYAPHTVSDGIDQVEVETLIWPLDGTREPAKPAQTESWDTLVGSAGYRMRLTVSQARGSYPSGLELIGPDQSARHVALPDDVNSFIPIGWSPSGDYYALHCRPLVDGNGDTVGGRSDILIISAVDCTVTAQWNPLGQAFWDGKRDVMYHAWTEDGAVLDGERLGYFAPDGTSGDGWELNGWSPDGRLLNDMQLVGSGAHGVVLTSGVGSMAQVWLLDPDIGPTLKADGVDVGTLQDWSEDAGLLVMPFTTRSSDGAEISVLDIEGNRIASFSAR